MSFNDEARFVPNSVYGCRRWTVRPDGSLWSFSASYQWESGWQVATCHGRPHHLRAPQARFCGCGFWAYWSKNGEHVRSADGGSTIAGIIEGKGSAVVGYSGFRISEARIVALVIPNKWPTRPYKRDLRSWVRFFLPVWCVLWILSYLALGAYAYAGHDMWTAGSYGGIVLAFTGLLWFVLRRAPLTQVERIRKRYPEVKIYGSWNAAFKDYPVEIPDWKRKGGS